MFLSRSAFGICLLAAAVPARAQQTKAATPVFTSSSTFSAITRVIEAPSGTLVLLDALDRTLWLLDPDLQNKRPLTTSGDGPGEIRFPFRLQGERGRVLAWDISLSRATLCEVAPPSCRTLTLPQGLRPVDLIGTDSLLRLYLTTSSYPAGRVGPDSAGIIRVDAVSGRIDTMAAIENPPTYEMVRHRETGTDRFIVPVPLVSGDQAIVSPSGTIVSIPGTGIALRLYSGVGYRSVPIVPMPAGRPISRRERDSLLHIADSLGYGASLRKALPPMKGALQPRTLLLAPNGLLWLALYAAGTSSEPGYEVWTLEGHRVGTLTLPPRARLVGLGARSYYVAQPDADDLETLSAYAQPAWPSTPAPVRHN